jgi:hypothetical protein
MDVPGGSVNGTAFDVITLPKAKRFVRDANENAISC